MANFVISADFKGFDIEEARGIFNFFKSEGKIIPAASKDEAAELAAKFFAIEQNVALHYVRIYIDYVNAECEDPEDRKMRLNWADEMIATFENIEEYEVREVK